MHVRAILAVFNFVVVGIALAIFFLVPSLASFAVYAVLIWMFASLLIFYLPWGNRQFRPTAPSAYGSSPSPGPGASSSSTPLPSSSIGFCIYCGTHLQAGATQCPACGRSVHYA